MADYPAPCATLALLRADAVSTFAIGTTLSMGMQSLRQANGRGGAPAVNVALVGRDAKLRQ